MVFLARGQNQECDKRWDSILAIRNQERRGLPHYTMVWALGGHPSSGRGHPSSALGTFSSSNKLPGHLVGTPHQFRAPLPDQHGALSAPHTNCLGTGHWPGTPHQLWAPPSSSGLGTLSSSNKLPGEATAILAIRNQERRGIIPLLGQQAGTPHQFQALSAPQTNCLGTGHHGAGTPHQHGAL